MDEQNLKSLRITIIAVVMTAIIIGGGVYAWHRSSLRSTKQSLQQQITDLQNQIANLKKTTQEPTQSNGTNTAETVTSKSGWIIITNQQLGIRFEHPADASVSSVSQRQTADGTTINELIVTPAEMDPTVVHFFTTNAPIDRAKNIQIYEFSKIENSEFTSATIDGRAGTRRIDHNLYNDCTDEITVVEKNNVVYGYHITQCPTHPQGYDQVRRDIANSLELQ